MVAIVTAFAGFGMWAEAQQGLTLRVAGESWSPGITAGEIGLTPMDAPGGTTDEVATANVTAFNNFFSTGWRTRGKTLVLDAKGYAINDTIVIPRIEGLCILGAGVGDTRAEVEYTTYGGACSRIVNIDSALDLMVDYSGANLYVRGVQFCGWWHATNGGTLKAATSDHARVGFLQRCGDGTVGSGKVTSPALVFSCCDVAIQMGDETVGNDADNADQWSIGSLRCLDCRVGIHSICRQSVGHTIHQYEGTRCGTMLYLERGGKWRLGQVTMENASPTFLKARAQTFDDNSVVVGDLYCDGSITGSPVIATMDATVANGDDGIPGNDDDEATASLLLRIHLLTFVASDALTTPTITLRGYSRVHILGGEQLKTGVITAYGGNSSFQHEVVLRDCRFRGTEDPTTFATLASGDGRLRMVLENNTNVGNVAYGDEYLIITRSGSNPPSTTTYVPGTGGASVTTPWRLRHRIERAEHIHAIAA